MFPLLKRVYFGPALNSKVYQKTARIPRKFVFKLHEGTDLPQLSSIIDLSLFLNISVNELLGYAYTQDPDNKKYYIKSRSINKKKNKWKEYNSSHYRRYLIPKANGSSRMIAAPKYRLKLIQRRILAEILQKAELPEMCTGFRKGMSIVDNAKPHLNANTVIKMDLKEFFPSLKFIHVFQVFQGFGYSRPIAGLLSCLCTDIYRKERYAPQGAPTSPMIANLYAKNFDARMHGFWSKKGFKFTRYADDLTISSQKQIKGIDYMIKHSLKIITDENLMPNTEKTKIYRKGNKKKITGIVVSDQMNPDRAWCMKLRAQIHQFKINKQTLTKEELRSEKNEIQGKIAFLQMINPNKAEKYRQLAKDCLNYSENPLELN